MLLNKYVLISIAVGIALLLMTAEKLKDIQATASPCPTGQVPVTDADGNIILNPDGSPKCQGTDALNR
jgi:hypothetical protein